EGCFLVVLNGSSDAQRRVLLGELGGLLRKLLFLLLHLAQLLLQAEPRLVALLLRELDGEIFQDGDAQGDHGNQQGNRRRDELAMVAEKSLQERPIDRADGTHCSPTILSRHQTIRFTLFVVRRFRFFDAFYCLTFLFWAFMPRASLARVLRPGS